MFHQYIGLQKKGSYKKININKITKVKSGIYFISLWYHYWSQGSEMDNIIKEMRKVNLDITEEGNVEDFLGVNIERRQDGSLKLTQQYLINQIINDLRLLDNYTKTSTSSFT